MVAPQHHPRCDRARFGKGCRLIALNRDRRIELNFSAIPRLKDTSHQLRSEVDRFCRRRQPE